MILKKENEPVLKQEILRAKILLELAV